MVFYFTATGNSKYIADRIAAATADQTKNIAECMANEHYSFELDAGERLGFVVPVYYYGIPIVCSEFLEKMRVSANHDYYSFAVLNCGGSTGDAGRFIKLALKIDAVFGVKTVDNYVPLFKVVSDDDIDKQLDAAENEIDKFISVINNNEPGTYNAVSGPLPKMLTTLLYPMYKRGRKTKKFRVNQNCTGCKSCGEICPREAIECTDGSPVWVKSQCEICLACLHRCPVNAIEYCKSANRGKFVNPRVQM
jgi:ferredoxin